MMLWMVGVLVLLADIGGAKRTLRTGRDYLKEHWRNGDVG